MLTGEDVNHVLTENETPTADLKNDHVATVETALETEGPAPTEEEKATLRRVHGKINATGYVLCFVDGANNASYYGVTGVFTNFIQRPLPAGGNGAVSLEQSMALRIRVRPLAVHSSQLVRWAWESRQPKLWWCSSSMSPP